jgi:hypothetical protein
MGALVEVIPTQSPHDESYIVGALKFVKYLKLNKRMLFKNVQVASQKRREG